MKDWPMSFFFCCGQQQGCGETGLGDEALVFDTWARLPPNEHQPFENCR